MTENQTPDQARHIEAGWRSYATEVLPPDASNVQREECRRAFFAGALTAFAAYVEIGDESITEAEGLARLDALADEFSAYQAALQAAADRIVASLGSDTHTS